MANHSGNVNHVAFAPRYQRLFVFPLIIDSFKPKGCGDARELCPRERFGVFHVILELMQIQGLNLVAQTGRLEMLFDPRFWPAKDEEGKGEIVGV